MKALIYQGGWDGHTPDACAKTIAAALKRKKVSVTISDSLDCLNKISELRKYDVIIPLWTMGKMTPKQEKNLLAAVRGGVGLAGFHGGMGDSMRGSLHYQWMTGGQFLEHPNVGKYEVYLTEMANEITKGMPTRFEYDSEQYYMMVDQPSMCWLKPSTTTMVTSSPCPSSGRRHGARVASSTAP